MRKKNKFSKKKKTTTTFKANNKRSAYSSRKNNTYSKSSSTFLNKPLEDTESTLKTLLKPLSRVESTDQKKLDPWQHEAFTALQEGGNVIVDAPTTAGKTRIVETFFDVNISRKDFRACYTCPVKSLSNDKMREFKELFGEENVGIATGDIKDNLDAPIVVATLETYRNSLLGTEPDLNRSLVIFDEYHFIQDESRGSAWEEAMILTPPNSQILLMSASLNNPHEFTAWLKALSKRPAQLIQVTHRPVPLKNVVWVKNNWFIPEYLPRKVLYAARKDFLPNLSTEQLSRRIKLLEESKLTPCIIYAGKRLRCIELAEGLKNHISPMTQENHFNLQKIISEYPDEKNQLQETNQTLLDLIEVFGVSYHHSGLTPQVRMLIERLLKLGLLRFCFSTMGLSLGINFSVRSTLISDFQRPGEKGMTKYGSSEVLQMTGRAGRRGRDNVGFSLWPDLSYYHRFAKSKREDGRSSLRIDPTTFLGLISQEYKLPAIERLYEKSFLKFNNPKANIKLLTKSGLTKILGTSLPCDSPAHELIAFRSKSNSLCSECPLKKQCHLYNKKVEYKSLALMHFHLHKIGALDDNERLSPYGEVARHFPQNGGLLISRMIFEGQLHEENLSKGIQLLAALSIARFKKPIIPSSYSFPFSINYIEDQLGALYPQELFLDVYDPPFGKRRNYAFRELNPAGGYLIREWALGRDWNWLTKQVLSDHYRDGDLSAIIYRVSSYLQSFHGLKKDFPKLSKVAQSIREELLREPVSLL